MSTLPAIRLLMPTPEPPPDTWILTPGWDFWYVSAQAWERFTMVSEPSTTMAPALSFLLQPIIPHATRATNVRVHACAFAIMSAPTVRFGLTGN